MLGWEGQCDGERDIEMEVRAREEGRKGETQGREVGGEKAMWWGGEM